MQGIKNCPLARARGSITNSLLIPWLNEREPGNQRQGGAQAQVQVTNCFLHTACQPILCDNKRLFVPQILWLEWMTMVLCPPLLTEIVPHDCFADVFTLDYIEIV